MPLSSPERLVNLGMPAELAKEVGAKSQIVALAMNTVTATTGTLPTPALNTVIADAAAPTVLELLDLCIENRATLVRIMAALKA